MAPSTDKPPIGFCGLGLMGFGMATHLIKQGYTVTGFDVFAATLDRFKSARGLTATSLADSARDAEFYICMVASAPQAQGALFGDSGVVSGLRKGTTLLLCSTVPAEYAKGAERQLEEMGRGDLNFVDCPVSGGAIRAANGTLSIMAGAKKEALEKARPILDELSEKLYIVPGGVGGGSNLKMAHQVLAGIHILAVSESLGLAARLGLDVKKTVEEVVKSEGWSWMFENRSGRTLKEDYYPGASALTIILKDVGIITTTARHLNYPLPLSNLTEQVYISALSQGYGPHDDAGVVRLYYPNPIADVTEPIKPTSPQTVTNLVPTTSTTTATTDTKSAGGIGLIINYLKAIHLLSAAEAISFASSLGLDLPQFESLVNDAAGGSTVFRNNCSAMFNLIQETNSKPSSSASGLTLESLAKDLATVMQEARRVECPMYLGSECYSLVEMAMRKGNAGRGAECVIEHWN